MKRPAKGRQALLWDSELRGFGVRMLPSGLQTFILNYRNAANKERRITLGRFGVMTVEQARDQAVIKLGRIAAGGDPAEAEDSHRQQATVSELCDWYLTEAEAGRILGRRNRPIKKSTLAMDRSRIETHIKPLLGTRLAHTLKVVDIEGMQSNIVAGKTAKPRGGGRGGAIRVALASRLAPSRLCRAFLVTPRGSTKSRAIPAVAPGSWPAKRIRGA